MRTPPASGTPRLRGRRTRIYPTGSRQESTSPRRRVLGVRMRTPASPRDPPGRVAGGQTPVRMRTLPTDTRSESPRHSAVSRTAGATRGVKVARDSGAAAFLHGTHGRGGPRVHAPRTPPVRMRTLPSAKGLATALVGAGFCQRYRVGLTRAFDAGRHIRRNVVPSTRSQPGGFSGPIPRWRAPGVRMRTPGPPAAR